jgi:CheY-like chemotaxis protein
MNSDIPPRAANSNPAGTSHDKVGLGECNCAEWLDSAKSSFLTTLHHEIRNPLNGMMAAFQMLRETDDPLQRTKLLDMGEAAGKAMLRLIGKDLDLAALDSREDILKPEWVDIPHDEVAEPKAMERVNKPPTLPQFEGMVLLVEDDDVSGPLAKLMLERLGLKVDLVTDGGQALETAVAGRYDLIFMDCWMPVAGGIEVTRKLRASPEMACWKTPVVALTGNATEADAAECRAAGMNDFMSKPILFDDLIVMLRKFLPTVQRMGA